MPKRTFLIGISKSLKIFKQEGDKIHFKFWKCRMATM